MEKLFFRYDYNYRHRILSACLGTVLLVISIFGFFHVIFAPLLLLLVALFFYGLTAFFFFEGIHVNFQTGYIRIIRDFAPKKLKIKDVQYIEYKIVKTEKKGLFNYLLLDAPFNVIGWSTPYYVYRNGVIVDIIFHMKSGEKECATYGGMYDEKSQKKVQERLAEIQEIIDAFERYRKQ